MSPTYRYRAVLDHIIDGDTYVLTVDVGFRVYVSVMVRLRGVNCPEPGKPSGDSATEFARFLLEGQPLLIESYKHHRSFARWVCDFWVVGDGEPVSVADALIEAGHGVPAAQ